MQHSKIWTYINNFSSLYFCLFIQCITVTVVSGEQLAQCSMVGKPKSRAAQVSRIATI